MHKRIVAALPVVVLLTALALTASASMPTAADLQGGIVCRFNKGDHDEWGYWKPGDTEAGQYTVLGWTWTGGDGGTGYSVTGADGAQAGPFTLAEFQAYIDPYLKLPLPYGCPPEPSQPLCDVWIWGGEGWADVGVAYAGSPGPCDCAGAGGRWVQDDLNYWGCVIGLAPWE